MKFEKIESLSPQQLQEIKGFVTTHVHGMLGKCVCQVAIVDSSFADFLEAVIASGTISLLNTGHSHLFVTNAHVYDEFVGLRSANSKIRLIVLGKGKVTPIDITEAPVIDHGRNQLDLVTLGIGNPEIVAELNKQFFYSSPWPPKRAEADELGIVVGFPTQHRKIEEGVVYSAQRSAIMPVAGSYEHQFVLRADNIEMMRIDFTESPSSAESVDHGGMSGSAVYLFDSNYNLRLGGFLYQTSDSINASIAVLHADYLLADGSIDAGKLL